jgi:hypothetical protein
MTQAVSPPGAPNGDSAVKPFLGTTKRLQEFSLAKKVVLVSGAARGLGLVQAEALLEAGATGIYSNNVDAQAAISDFV